MYPVRIRIVVVFPAPLGPRKPRISPLGTSNEMSSTAVTRPYCFVRCSTLITAWCLPREVLKLGLSGPRRRNYAFLTARRLPGPLRTVRSTPVGGFRIASRRLMRDGPVPDGQPRRELIVSEPQ